MNEEFYKAKDIDDAEIIICGIPFDGTVSFRPGSRFAPSAIRNVLYGLETYSPYQDKDITDYKVFDTGDVEIPIGNTERTLKTIEDFLTPLFAKKKKILSLGGEHLITLPIIKAALIQYPSIKIIHFDAHTDMREDYIGEKLSHSTVMRRIGEITGFKNIFQFGIRSGLKAEWDFCKSNGNFNPFNTDNAKNIADSINDKEPIYISLDMDVLDPSYFPGTGTPEPCGITTKQLLDALLAFKNKNVIGADIVELSPDYDKSGISSVTASFFLRELALILT